MKTAELVIALILFALGARSLVHWVRAGIDVVRPSDAVWFALFVLGRVGCWWGVAGIFAISASISFEGRAFLDEWRTYSWYILVPLGAGALQLMAAWFLARDREPRDAA